MAKKLIIELGDPEHHRFNSFEQQVELCWDSDLDSYYVQNIAEAVSVMVIEALFHEEFNYKIIEEE